MTLISHFTIMGEKGLRGAFKALGGVVLSLQGRWGRGETRVVSCFALYRGERCHIDGTGILEVKQMRNKCRLG